MSIIADITNKFVPVQMITVFKDSQRNYYLESTEIEDGLVKESKPLSEETLSDIVEYFADIRKDEDTIRGVIPGNVLYCSWSVEHKVLVWYNKPMPRQMYFTPSLHIPSGIAEQPTIIYIIINNDLSVFVARKGVIQMDTRVYVAPYHNCQTEGDVCIGSAKVRKPSKPTFENIMEYWEKKFWNTEFSHLTAGKVSNTNINLYWKKAIKSGEEFDYSILIPSKLKTIMDNLKANFRNA